MAAIVTNKLKLSLVKVYLSSGWENTCVLCVAMVLNDAGGRKKKKVPQSGGGGGGGGVRRFLDGRGCLEQWEGRGVEQRDGGWSRGDD